MKISSERSEGYNTAALVRGSGLWIGEAGALIGVNGVGYSGEDM